MTEQPPALHGSRKVTVLGWSAVIVAVILLIVLTTALVGAYGAAQGKSDVLSIGSVSPTPSAPSPAATSDSTPSPTADAPADTPAPAPVPAPEDAAPPGNAVAPVEQAPVPLTGSATVVPQVVFTLGTLEAVDGVAQGPGEVAGPALRFTLTVRNDTAASVSLAATVVNLYAGVDQTPSIDLAEPGGVPLPNEVKPGKSVTGTFVFAVPRDARNPVKITVDYSVGVPIVVFQGPAPT